MRQPSRTLHPPSQKEGWRKLVRLPFPVQVRNKGVPLWTRHPNADVAAMRVRLPKDVDVKLISTNLLGTDKALE